MDEQWGKDKLQENAGIYLQHLAYVARRRRLMGAERVTGSPCQRLRTTHVECRGGPFEASLCQR